jgi:hypothetical protein
MPPPSFRQRYYFAMILLTPPPVFAAFRHAADISPIRRRDG